MLNDFYFDVTQLGRRLAATVLVSIIGIFGSLSADAAPWGNAPITQASDDWLKNCLIYTTQGVDAAGPFQIFGDPVQAGSILYRSDVCSLGSIQLGGNAQATRVPFAAPTQQDVAVVSPTISLQQYSRTSECVYDTAAGGSLTIGPQPSIVPCPVKRDEDLSGMPPDITQVVGFPFPVITPGVTPADDITVGTGETKVLPGPGQYGRVFLKPSSQLVFPRAGDYQFWSIVTTNDAGAPSAEARADIIINDLGINIMVKEYMFLGHRSQVNRAQTRLLKVFVAGQDDVIIDGASRTAFTYRGDGYFNACYVYSPYGSQSWRGRSLNNNGYKTQSFGQNFIEDTIDQFLVRMRHPQDEQCFGGSPPDVRCDYKIFSPSSLSDPDGVVNAEVKISNVGQGTANVVIKDTMGAKMTYRPDTSSINNSSIGNPTGGPPTYTFPVQSISANNSLILTYQVDIKGLNEDERVCNNVQVTATTNRSPDQSDRCHDCVTYEPPTSPVPAVGLWGLSVLVAVFAGIGGWLGYSRRKGGLTR